MSRVPGSPRRFNATDWRCLLVSILTFAGGCAAAKPCPAVGLRPLPLLVADYYSWKSAPCSYGAFTREADSLQPTLRWEPFPRPEDLTVDKAGRLVTVRNPTYELRIWRAADDFPAELVYVRNGLSEPIHTVETPLAPEILYLWTIRARFALDGEPRVTEWGVPLLGEGSDARGTEIPTRWYYRFKTPKR
jgi:hypothetical protein